MDNLNHRIMIKGAKAQQHDMKLPYSMAPYTSILPTVYMSVLFAITLSYGLQQNQSSKALDTLLCQINKKPRINVPMFFRHE